MEAISDEMLALPTTCAADFAAKVIIETCDGGVVLGEDSSLWSEARTLITAASSGQHV